MIIYKIINAVNGKIYFGKTSNLNRRWYDHKYDAAHGSMYPIHCAIRKYGADNFTVNIIDENLTDNEANLKEIELIASVHQRERYNVAVGGNGGNTMTQFQIENQYTIKPNQYDLFRSLFNNNITAIGIAKELNVSFRAVRRTAVRLGLSFQNRKASKPKIKIERKLKTNRKSKATMTQEERYKKQSELCAKNNIDRGIKENIKQQILSLYFTDHLTAKDVATKLGTTRGSVRATVNAFYASITKEEHKRLKKEHGSIVRSGSRNTNYRGKS